ncbi:hypothetical protein OFC55_35250, partial [Escherichia coli]|nr:hypothetical protein [Escherichia coli]
WLLSITDKHLYSMATAVFFENLCGGMGTAAFVALLMTLCNKSFSATQFALLSALWVAAGLAAAGWYAADAAERQMRAAADARLSTLI